MLRLGIGSAALLALAGGGVALLQPGLVDARLGAGARTVFRAVGRAVLDGSLPTGAAEQGVALDGLLVRLDDTVAGFPPAVRDELSQLLGLLAVAPGRIGLAGLGTPWSDASVAEVQHALQGMRTSSLALRQQAYHALRDLCNAAYFSDPATWSRLGYPGPTDV